MDLQTRKLNLIQYLVGLQDEKLIQEIEILINKSRVDQDNLLQLTEDDLINRANESNSDYKNGQIIDQKHLEKESNNW